MVTSISSECPLSRWTNFLSGRYHILSVLKLDKRPGYCDSDNKHTLERISNWPPSLCYILGKVFGGKYKLPNKYKFYTIYS